MTPIPIKHFAGHQAGISFIAYGSGDEVVSCGQDGLLKIWPRMFENNECEAEYFISVSECCTALDVLERKAYVATDRSVVLVYDLDTRRKISTFTTARLPITFITHTPALDQVIVASADFEIRAIEVADTTKVKYFLSHRGPILGMACSSDGSSMCSTSCDGSAKIWSLEFGTLLKSFDLLSKSNDLSTCRTFARPCFAFHGDNEDEIFLVPTDESVAVITTSPNIAVSQRIANVTDPKSGPQAVAFSSFHSVIAVAFSDGRITLFDSNLSHPPEAVFTLVHPHPINQIVFAKQLPFELWLVTKHGNLGMIKASTMANCMSSSALDGTNENNVENYDDDELCEEITADVEEISPVETTTVKPKRHQAYFQNNSTPKHPSNQYILVWNKIGLVVNYTSEHTILVEFHNTLHHHNFSVENVHDRYDMASLSSNAIVVAGPKHLKCIIYQSKWTGNEWELKSSHGDRFLGVCSNEQRIFVMYASSNTIRVFANGGRPTYPNICITGKIITTICSEKYLAVCHHHQTETYKCTLFEFVIGDMDTIKCSFNVDLCPKGDVLWMGFGESKGLYYFDQSQNLYLMQNANPTNSHPVTVFVRNCEGAKPEDRSGFVSQLKRIWPIAIHENGLYMLAVQCKQNYPATLTPRPGPIRLPLSIDTNILTKPVDSAHVSNSENGILTHLFYGSDPQNRAFIECVLKAFQLACKQSSDLRATQLLPLMDIKCLRAALKCADRLGRTRVSHEINEFIEQKCSVGERSDPEPRNVITPSTPVIVNRSSRLNETLKQFTKSSNGSVVMEPKCPFKTTNTPQQHSRQSVFSKIIETPTKTKHKELVQTSLLESFKTNGNKDQFSRQSAVETEHGGLTPRKRSAFEIFYQEHSDRFPSQSEAVTAFVKLDEQSKKAYVQKAMNSSNDDRQIEPMDCDE